MGGSNVMWTRREFLRGGLVAGAGAFLPAFLARTAGLAWGEEGGVPGFPDGRILVVLQLGGGNDGLNMIVPFADDAYRKARPTLGIAAKDVLKAGEALGLHPRLTGLKDLFDDGKVAIVSGVGYPNPDRSHFRSMDIWQTASDSDRYDSAGWLGRYFDACCDGKPDTVAGVNVGSQMPVALSGSAVGVSFQDPARFRWTPGDAADSGEAWRRIIAAGQPAEPGSTLDFLRHTTANVAVSSDKVIAAARKTRPPAEYPQGRLSNDLKTVANLIAAGLPTRIFYVSFTGFDTHAGQLGQHENLFRELGDALKAFRRDLAAIGAADRTLVMAFSEFGRRVQENASGGTDHGTAGPMFLIGDAVKGGFHGKFPSLTDLDQGDLKHTTDFRSVYATVLEKWITGDSQKVLGRKFPVLDLLKA